MSHTVLILGGGAREHALAVAAQRSPRVATVWCVPGNGGMTAWMAPDAPALADPAAIARWARDQGVTLAIVGPEGPLAAGQVDHFEAVGIRAVGPHAPAAQLEASKAFAKAFMDRHGIPTAAYAVATTMDEAHAHVDRLWQPEGLVVKADGLAGGKGVVVARTPNEAHAAIRSFMGERSLGEAGLTLVIEQLLEGPEISYLALVDGKTWLALPPARDHKALLDGGLGPNTGGMGVVAPVALTTGVEARISEEIMAPFIRGLAAEGLKYHGVVFVGLMLTATGPKVLEFNVRLGDPEGPTLLPGLLEDPIALFEACLDGELSGFSSASKPGVRVCVVAATPGYPQAVETGLPITGLDAASAVPGITIFHAGTALNAAGELVTAGGRVLEIVADGADLATARARAYQALAFIRFGPLQPVYRTDIGVQGLREVLA